MSDLMLSSLLGLQLCYEDSMDYDLTTMEMPLRFSHTTGTLILSSQHSESAASTNTLKPNGIVHAKTAAP